MFGIHDVYAHLYPHTHIIYIYICMLWMNKWSQSCSCFLVTCAQPFIHVPWGSNSRRGNPQPLWLTGSSWWEGWGSAWSHRIEANPFWFAEDSIYRWHQCLWSFCLEAWQHLPSWLLVKTFASALELVKGIFYQCGAIHTGSGAT